jgi:DNA-binding transcriptional ArsR family regulator
MAARHGADPVDTRVVKALGHPTRIRILEVLRDRELASPVELSAEFDIPLGTVGYHVRRLESLGFIELARRTQRRGAVEHHYRARRALDEVGNAPDGSGADGRGREALAIAHAAHAALGHGGFDAVAARADGHLLALDARGRSELERTLTRCQAGIERIARRSAARIARSGTPPVHRCAAVLMCFDVPAD